ncbi:MAG: hypothetical protein M5U28_11780 [Sandaracinaceae bacterium]|nr:hypothetical protein [Sandaracinaceae bacterium]
MTEAFYHTLLAEAAHPIYHRGGWTLCETLPGLGLERLAQQPDRLRVAVRKRAPVGRGQLRGIIVAGPHPAAGAGAGRDDWRLRDVMTGVHYERDGDDMAEFGLYVDCSPGRCTSSGSVEPMTSRHFQWMMVALLLVGFWLRVDRLDTWPPGVSLDEAGNVMDAFQISHTGKYPVYENPARPEPLYQAMLAVMAFVVEPGVWTMRLVNVYTGLLTLAALYWTARQCLYDRDPTARGLAGLAAAAALAVALSHVVLSRSIYRAGPQAAVHAALCRAAAARAAHRGPAPVHPERGQLWPPRSPPTPPR